MNEINPPTGSENEAAALQTKLDHLHRDFERLAQWAHANSSSSSFAIQVYYFAKARLQEWDLPVEEWEP